MVKQNKTIETVLQELVAIPSVFPNENKVSDYIASFLKQFGFHIDIVLTEKKRKNIVGTFGNAKKYLGFYGHMDTVPREDYANAFKVSQKGNKATGLGVEDMKGGIAAILKAAQFASENNLPVKVVFGVDEEDISQGAHDLVDSGLLHTISFLIVGESGQIKKLTQPFNVCYGRNGRVLLEAVISGKKAHAAESEQGVNAVEKAAELVLFLQQLTFPLHKNLGKTRIIVQSITGSSDSFSVPESCKITFPLLTTPAITGEEIKKKILSFAKTKNIIVSLRTVPRKTPYGESFEVDEKNRFLQLLEREIFKKNKVNPIYTPSVADENIFANRLHIPVISIGPIGGGGHTVDEWLDMRSLRSVAEVYKQIVTLCCGNIVEEE